MQNTFQMQEPFPLTFLKHKWRNVFGTFIFCKNCKEVVNTMIISVAVLECYSVHVGQQMADMPATLI